MTDPDVPAIILAEDDDLAWRRQISFQQRQLYRELATRARESTNDAADDDAPFDPAQLEESVWPQLQLDGLRGRDFALCGLNHPLYLRIPVSLGDYAFAFHQQSLVRVEGGVGHGVADGMRSGTLRIHGHAGHGAGVGMCGGTLAIYGNAGPAVGAGIRGGEIFIRGDAGPRTGVGAVRGTIMIGGDAGEELGDATSGASIFLRGAAASLSPGMVEAPLRQREVVRLGLLLLNAGIRGEAKDFRRILPQQRLDAENQSDVGQVLTPSWR
ncbi:MAG: tributyrin esterase [Planctomycetota bacterium]